MNIVVCVKHTPVTTAEKHLDAQYLLDRENLDNALNTYDEPAVEEALRLQEAHGGPVTFLCMGQDEAVESLRKALAMAGDRDARAVLVADDALHGSDIWCTALALSAAARKLNPDLLIFGLRSDDAATGVLAGAVAQLLDLPLLTNANKVMVEGARVRSHRRVPDGYILQEAAFPLVLGVTDAINTPRYPSLKGIMGAKKKPLEEWDIEDLGLSTEEVGLAGAKTQVLGATTPPPRQRGEILTDTGDVEEHIVQYLAARKVI